MSRIGSRTQPVVWSTCLSAKRNSQGMPSTTSSAGTSASPPFRASARCHVPEVLAMWEEVDLGADICPRLIADSPVSSRAWVIMTLSTRTGCMWSTTARGKRRRCCSFTDRGLRAPLGARWSGHSPATVTSSGSTFRGAANPRPHYRTTFLSRQAGWLCCSTTSGCGTSPWPGTPAAATSLPRSPNSAPTWWGRSL